MKYIYFFIVYYEEQMSFQFSAPPAFGAPAPAFGAPAPAFGAPAPAFGAPAPAFGATEPAFIFGSNQPKFNFGDNQPNYVEEEEPELHVGVEPKFNFDPKSKVTFGDKIKKISHTEYPNNFIKYHFVAETNTHSFVVYMDEPLVFYGKNIVMSYNLVVKDGDVLSNHMFLFRTGCPKCFENGTINEFKYKVHTYFQTNTHIPYFIYQAFMYEFDRASYV